MARDFDTQEQEQHTDPLVSDKDKVDSTREKTQTAQFQEKKLQEIEEEKTSQRVSIHQDSHQTVYDMDTNTQEQSQSQWQTQWQTQWQKQWQEQWQWQKQWQEQWEWQLQTQKQWQELVAKLWTTISEKVD